MEYKIDTADKKVLVDIVKLAQKRGMKGKMGDWKEFLSSHDKQFGARMSDPSKKPHEILAAFLKTFSKDEDLKFFINVMKQHSNQYILERLKERSYDSPEQSLVQETLQHPLYPLDYSFPSIDEGWLVISLKRKSKGVRSTTMLAVDCEMVLCEDGTEALVKVCVVDHNLEVKLHKLVKPDRPVIDYRTEITGVSSEDLNTVTCSLADVQKSLRKLIDGNILVGHSLYNDLRVLKIDYVRVIDTAYIFKPVDGSIHRRPSLNGLCQSVLGYEVRQKGAPHDCLDDASATMKLVLARIKHGVDKPFPLTLVQEKVSEIEMTKLLLHRIPTTVNSEALREIIPGDFTLEVKPPRNGQGNMYSAVAIFKNHQEARDAYESFQGSLSKDSNGHPQKSVTFRLSTGMSVSLFVRRLASHAHRKRDLQVDGTDDVSKNKKIRMDPEVEKDALNADDVSKNKKIRMDPEVEKDALNAVDDSKGEVKVDPEIENDALEGSSKCDSDAHLKEIEALNQQLKERELEIESLKEQLRKKDFEITTLHNMVANIKKRRPQNC